MKNKALKTWLKLKENEMLAEIVQFEGVVIDDHDFVRGSAHGVLSGFVCKKCKLGIGYETLEGEYYGAPGVGYPF